MGRLFTLYLVVLILSSVATLVVFSYNLGYARAATWGSTLPFSTQTIFLALILEFYLWMGAIGIWASQRE